MFRKYIGTVYIVPLPGFHEVPQYYCPSWVLSNILASYLENWFFTKIFFFIMKNWYLSHLLCVSYFFIFVFVVLSRCICLFVVIRIVKIQDLQLLFITSDKAFMEILLGQKFFPNISSWSFLREEFVHFSWSMQSLHNHVWNSVHYAPVVCLTTFIFHLLCPNF